MKLFAAKFCFFYVVNVDDVLNIKQKEKWHRSQLCLFSTNSILPATLRKWRYIAY